MSGQPDRELVDLVIEALKVQGIEVDEYPVVPLGPIRLNLYRASVPSDTYVGTIEISDIRRRRPK